MGANFVMLGRPFMFALGAEGAHGVNALMRILGEDTSLTLAQTGLADIDEVTPSILNKCPPELLMEALGSSKNVT